MANALSALAERRTNKVWTIVLLALGFSDGNLGLGAAVFLFAQGVFLRSKPLLGEAGGWRRMELGERNLDRPQLDSTRGVARACASVGPALALSQEPAIPFRAGLL